jgi:hypothetical protein
MRCFAAGVMMRRRWYLSRPATSRSTTRRHSRERFLAEKKRSAESGWARLVLAEPAMALRTFLASDGSSWTAWLVQTSGIAGVPGAPTEWLAFQNEDGTERRRLLEVPSNWDKLPDDRLDLARRMAEPVRGWASRHTPPGGIGQQDPSAAGDTNEG